MKKRNVYKLMMLCVLLMFGLKGIRAQVGINTDIPKATLDIKGKPTEPNEMDGLLVPRLTGDELQSKTYGLAQNGALIFATERANSPSGQVVDVTGKGLYYFSAQENKWVRFVDKGVNLEAGDHTSIHFFVSSNQGAGTEIVGDGQVLDVNNLFEIFLYKSTNANYHVYVKNISNEDYVFSSHAYKTGVAGDEMHKNQILASNDVVRVFRSADWDTDFRTLKITLEVMGEYYEGIIAPHKTILGGEKEVLISIVRLF